MKKTALITGGSRGIGAAVALKLARDGFIPVINYLSSRERAEKIAADTGGIALCADVSDMEQVMNMVNTVNKKLGKISLLVNNAGISCTGLFNDITLQQEKRLWEVNVGGVFNCTRAVLPDMIRNKSASIISISSMWGQVGASCEVHYSAAKSAVIGFTKALAKEVGPSGIRVNCIAPGMIMTDMTSGYTEDVLCELKDETPLEKLGCPEDIAEAVSFLASDSASFITGQVIGVNGGFVI